MTLVFYILALFLTVFVAGILIGVIFIQVFSKKISEEVAKNIVRHWRKHPELMLQRVDHNPVLSPLSNSWEENSVFNPAVVHIDGKFHMLYRALGSDGVSRLGYASSSDGTHFDERLPYPVYATRTPGGTPYAMRRYSPVLYPSGGSWGGCEDPRMVTIDDRVYVTFNMFDNWKLRIGVISISKFDFLKKAFWKWRGPTIISSGTREKNWTLFPEKIHGKFAVLHGIIDDDIRRVRIVYTDNLDTLSQEVFETVDPQGVPDKLISWHVHVRSTGPPPIKTQYGWLILYHAHDADEMHRYKFGAMLLDLDDPTKILCRSPQPILEPDTYYENEGKPHVVYACGAVIKDNTLFVYYGGGDRVVAVASVALDAFMSTLMHNYKPELINV